MKILFFTHYGKMMGANRSMLDMIIGLKKQGIKCKVFSPEAGDLKEACTRNSIEIDVLPFCNDVYFTRGFSRLKGLFRHLKNIINFGKILRHTQKYSPDIIHSNATAIHIGAKIAYKLGIPHVWHLREFGTEDYQMKYNLGYANFYSLLDKSKQIIAISKAINNHYSPHLSSKVTTMYNGVVNENRIKNNSQPIHSPFNFVIIGALKPEKGQREAISAFGKAVKINDNCKLQIVGDSPDNYIEELKSQVKELKLESKVEFTGYIPDPTPYYENADCLLMCSKNEGMGRVTVEAMANGVPVIGYNGGATPEIVEDGKNGFLYRTQDELVEKMIFLSENPTQKLMLGEMGISLAKEKFSIENYTQKIIKIYEDAFA